LSPLVVSPANRIGPHAVGSPAFHSGSSAASAAGGRGGSSRQEGRVKLHLPKHGPHKLQPRPPPRAPSPRATAQPAAPPAAAPSFRGPGAPPRSSAPSGAPSGSAAPPSSAACSAHRPAPRSSPRPSPHPHPARHSGGESKNAKAKGVTEGGMTSGKMRKDSEKSALSLASPSPLSRSATSAAAAAARGAVSAARAGAENAADGATDATGSSQVTKGFKEEEWQQDLALFAGDSGRREMVLTGKESRRYEQDIKRIAAQFRIHSRMYNKSLVLSKDPLPHYRPELDSKRPQRQLSFPPEVLQAIDRVVVDVRAKREREEERRREEERKAEEERKREERNKAAAAAGGGGGKREVGGRGLAGLQRERGEEGEDGEEEDLEEDDLEEEERVVSSGEGRMEEDEEERRRRLWRINESLKRRQLHWQASPEGASMLALRQSLPAWKERERLLQAVQNNQVVVVSGETGCGKTTQLPQYLLEEAISSGQGAQSSIICTQPRRISAVAVAERVAAERGESIGQSVGYQVRLEARRSRGTHLLFCTTGVLLRRLASDPLLNGVTHIVVDEIHERGMNEDFLLIVLRDLLPRRPDLKLVLMSATLNADLFSQYYSGAPTLHIPGFTYPVRSYFLEDVLELTGHEVTLHNQVDDYGSEQQWRRRRQMALMEKRRRSLEPSFVQEALADHSFTSHSPFVQRSMERWTGEGVGFSLIEAALEFAVKRGPRLLAQMQREGGREGRGEGRREREWTQEGEEREGHSRRMVVRGEQAAGRDPMGGSGVGVTGRVGSKGAGAEEETGAIGSKDAGAVLVFMTGWDDIIAMRDRLREHPVLGDERKVLLLTCHGSMPIEEQKLIFNPPPEGITKVILATNMAETSITINDVALVIDTGKAKETSYDAVNNVPCLLPQWVSKASVKQRRGRAGRVRPGVCFHLYPRPLFAALPDYGQPELLRAPLHSLCLQIKTLGLGNIGEFLGKAMQPPEPLAVDNAIELLEDVGALDKDENLTPLGRHLTALPLEPRVGKMLVMAALLSCVNPLLTVAATLSEREPWVRPADKREVADSVRLRFAGDDCSDHFAAVRAFEGWVAALGSGDSPRDGYNAARAYCYDHFLSHPTMQAIAGLRRQLLGTLGELGLVNVLEGMGEANMRSNEPELVRAALLAGLFPGVASAVKRARSTAYKTEEDGEVNIHQSSVNAGLTRFPYPWLVFNEKIKTTSVFIRDSTGVSDAALLLFGGPLTPTTDPGYLHMMDGYFEFFMPPAAARSVLGLRSELDSLIQRKLESPRLPLTPEDEAVLGAVTDLLQCEQPRGTFTVGLVPKLAPPKPEKPVKAKAVDMKLEAGKDVKSYVHNNCKIHFLGRPRYFIEQVGTKQENIYQCTMRLGGAAAGIDFVGEPASTKKVAEWNAAVEGWKWILEYKKVDRKEKQAKEEVKKCGRKERKERRKANHKMEERWEYWRKKYEEEEAAKWREKGGKEKEGRADMDSVVEEGEVVEEVGRRLEEKDGGEGRKRRKGKMAAGKDAQELLPLSQAKKGAARAASKRKGNERAEERGDWLHSDDSDGSRVVGGGERATEGAGEGVGDGDGVEWADMAESGEEEGWKEKGRRKGKSKGKGRSKVEVLLPSGDDEVEDKGRKKGARKRKQV
ncbi:hypothetical protein CLOM_g11175, partial [Closterium sp. NIES-68]